MSLVPGTRLGPYELLGPIGAGGMGEVYRARDTKLNREVAIKAMLAVVAQDPDRVARFEREAQLLASLNHPNIAAIYGVEEAGGARYLVLEFVDGRPLSDLLRQGALPPAEALAIARQIADALAATHERGIIHRDLKPGNVMVTADGHVKVLDFGLGKALVQGDGSRLREQDASPLSPSNSPTMTMAATAVGLILGTAGYMSPEQAKGRNADKRSDVWAFGCVLFEMLTGTRAFDGEDITETLAAIVRGEPDWAALPGGTPPAIRALLERCLVKNRAERLADMSIVRFVLNEPGTLGSGPQPVSTVPAPARAIRLSVAVAMVAAAILGTAGLMRVLSSRLAASPNGERVSLTIALPGDDVVGSTRTTPIALSPDGAYLAYSGVSNGKSLVFVRALADQQPKALDGTDGATMPFFDPTGRWIGFFAQGKLKKIGIGGTGLTVVTDNVPYPRGGTWAANGTIYFAPGSLTGIFAVPASGGTARAVTKLDSAAGEISHRFPQILPDQQTLLFNEWIGPGVDERQVMVLTLATGERHMLVAGADTPRFVNGHLVYVRKDRLFAVPWQPGQTSLGTAVPIELPEHPRTDFESAGYALSETGNLAYLQGDPGRHEQSVQWVNRNGQTEALPLPGRDYDTVALSPKGDRAVMSINDGRETLWVYEFSRNTLTPFVTSDGSSQAPLWTPDGAHVIYRGTRAGRRNLYWKRADGMGGEEALTNDEGVLQTPQSVSPDGQWLVFTETGGSGGTDALVLPLAEPQAGHARAARPLVRTQALENYGRVSPDGHWLAYASDQSGRSEVYVLPFPVPGPSQQVSAGGATEPLWSHSGHELFYVPSSGDGLMAVPVSLSPTFSAGQPRQLYAGRYRASPNTTTGYDISLDDKRFLRVQQGYPDVAITRIEVVLNWFSRLMPGGGASR